jgi:co-chaperonin GroES (HSP10)
MNIVGKYKDPKPQPLCQINTRTYIPWHRTHRGKRYNAKGQGKPKVADSGFIDYLKFRPLPGRILVARGPLVTEENGVALPESAHFRRQGWVVISVASDVKCVGRGETVIFQKNHSPKEAGGPCMKLGKERLYIAKEAAVAAVLNDPLIRVETYLQTT